MSEPVLRAAGPDDDEAIAACIGEAFPDNPKSRLDVLRWQYRSNPFGSTASWVWDDGGRVVAHYSAYPMPAVGGGVIANAVDAAVLPSHQGQRLFSPLAAALYEGCAAAGMPVAVCYASNPVAMKGVARAGVEWQPRLRTLVAPALLLRGRGGEEVAGPPAAIEALWRTTVERDGIASGVDRGEAWWRWRYADSPLGPYRFLAVDDRAAAVVLERREYGRRFGYVLELLALDRSAARAVLHAAARGVDALVTLAVDRGPLQRVARWGGLRTVPRRLEPKGAWYGVIDQAGGDPARPWHVGWGDMDHL